MPVKGFLPAGPILGKVWSTSLLAGLAVLLTATAAASASAAGEAQGGATGRYIVLFKNSVDRPGAIAQDQVEQRDGRLGFVYRHALKGYSATLPKSAAENLKSDPRVAHVEPDVAGGGVSQTIPTGIDRIFATANEALYIDGIDELRVDADVAVLDTGIYEHADLNVVSRIDCYNSSPCAEGGVDGNGHGTHVAGTIAAIDNGEGVVGVAPGARLWSVKILNDARGGLLSHYIAGIDWVTGTREDEDPENDIDVVNASVRYLENWSPSLDVALDASVDAGIVNVASAGNDSEPVKSVPGNHPDVITVSALADYDGQPGFEASPTCKNEGSDDRLAGFSNYGELVEVAAPGVCIYSTWLGNGYGYLSGTSMAAPHVAGAAAILASLSNPVSREEVEAIRETIVEEGNFDWFDTIYDETQEPLLDVSDEEVFRIEGVEAPSATTEAATDVLVSSAKLHGSVNPNGAITSYHFEYGTTTEYTHTVPASPKGVGGGTKAVAVVEPINGLEPSTTYHYRVVAENPNGYEPGEDETFTTLEAKAPSATTEAATVSAYGTALNAAVNPNGTKTSYQFEYGTTTSYGTKVPAAAEDIGSGTAGVPVSKWLEDLEATSTYHYRVVATNAFGTTYGEDKAFETPDWSVVSSPNEGEQNAYSGVSCIEGDWCMAIGSRESSESSGPQIATRLAGQTSWQGLSPPADMEVNGLSCVAYKACMTVGSEEGDAWAEMWVLEGWYTFPVKEVPGTSSSLSGASCEIKDECWAVGSYAESGEEQALAVQLQPFLYGFKAIETPTAGQDSKLSSVSCTAVGSCMAVGHYVTELGEERPLTMLWDGEEWATQAVPGFESEGTDTYLSDVSCSGGAGPGACVAVGVSEGEEVPRAAVSIVWDGSEWAEAPPASPEETEASALHGVSCLSETKCLAAGEYTKWWSEPWEARTLIEEWDGEEWSVRSLPEVEANPGSVLNDISCKPSAECAAVGFSSVFEVTQTLALRGK